MAKAKKAMKKAVKKARKSACRIAKFGDGREVKFCAKELSPAKKAAKARRAKRILKAFACSAKKTAKFPALKKACRSRKLAA
jgi:hypothetical protein